eukprot:PITA_21843
MTSFHINEAWDLVELLGGRKPIGSKWVFRKKTNAKGKVEKYKARLVAKGYSQGSGIDFGDIVSPVAKVTSIRLLLFVAATFDFEVEQMDVKKTFLQWDLQEEIYIKQLECFVVKGKKELDSKLVKVPIHVGVKLSVEQHPKTQEEEEDMSCAPYASAVGSLMYAMVCTRPDITHEVGVLSRFMSKLGKGHWIVVKRVFRYLRGTSDYDWAGDLDQRRSTSGYVFNLFGGVVSWMSKKQSVEALSTTEAEYMAATHASNEVVWLQRLCSSMGLVKGVIRIDCDNKSAIFLVNNPTYHSKTKQIDVQYHFVRDIIEDKKVLVVKMDTLKNTADALTKSVSSEKFSWCRETMGIAGLDK